MNWIRSRLSAKLTVIVLLLIFTFAGCISLLLYQRSITFLELEAYGRLEQMVRASANELDIEIANTIQIADTLETLMQEGFDPVMLKQDPEYLSQKIQHLDPYVKVIAQEFSLAKTAYLYYNWELDGKVHDIYYVDTDHDGSVSRQAQLPISYYTDQVSEKGTRAWWFGPIQSRKGYWSSPYKWMFDDGTSTVFLSYTQAVFKDGRLIGVAGTDFKYENLLALMGKIKVYDSGYPFLLTGERKFLIHPTQSGKPLADMTQEPYKTLREELPFKSKGAFRYLDGEGKAWFITYQRLRNDWTLGLAAPISEVTESAGSLTQLSLWIVGISIPLIVLASFLVVRQMTVPIHELIAAVEKIKAREHMLRLSSQILSRQDELGRLGNAIQNLGDSLEEERAVPVHRAAPENSESDG